MKKNPGIQILNSNLKDQYQVSVNQQEPRIQKRQNYSCQGMGNIELPSKLKKFEKPHEQEIVLLCSIIEKMNTNLNPEGKNQNLKLLFQAKKKEDKGQVSQIQFQIEALTSKFVLIEKRLTANPQEIEEKVHLEIKEIQPETVKMEIEQNILQQNAAIVVKGLDIYGGNVCSEKECMSSIDKNLEHRGGYIVTALRLVVVDSNVTLLKQELDNQWQQNKQLQKTTMTLQFIQRSWRKIIRRQKNNFMSLLKRKKNYLSLKLIQMKTCTVEQ